MASTEDTVSVTLSGTVTLAGVDSSDTYPVTITATASGGATVTASTVASVVSGGSYKMSVPPGQVTVTFKNSQLPEVSEIILAAFSTPNVLDVTMGYATLAGTITVVSAGSGSQYKVTITVSADGTTLATTTTMAEGGTATYSISNLPAGNCNVTFSNQNLFEANETAVLSLTEANVLDVEMTIIIPMLQITGTVVSGRSTETGMEGGTIVLEPGGTVSGATITVTSLDTGSVLGTTTSDSNGYFSIEVHPGSASVIAKKNGVTYPTNNLNENIVNT